MTTATATAPVGNGKKTRQRLPQINKVFLTKESLDAGQKEAIEKGHKFDTRKFSVTSSDGKHVRYVLAWGAGNAAAQVVDAMGLKVEELDPTTKSRTAVLTTENAVAALSKMAPADLEAILKALGRKK